MHDVEANDVVEGGVIGDSLGTKAYNVNRSNKLTNGDVKREPRNRIIMYPIPSCQNSTCGLEIGWRDSKECDENRLAWKWPI